MLNLLKDRYINTSLGTFKVSVRPGDTLLIFLNGYGPYDTAQIFQPIIQKITKEIGVLAIDYLDSGLSSSSTRSFLLTDEADLITRIIQNQHASKIVIIAHSLGGFYALYIAQKLNQLIGFIGIGPITKEVLLDPPDEANYNRDAKEDSEMTEDEITNLMHERIYTSFQKTLANKIWNTALISEEKDSKITKPHGLNLGINILKRPDFSDLSLDQTVSTTLFVRLYRINEYSHSEYYTEKTTIEPLGKNHYIHFEFPEKISEAILKILKENNNT